MWRSIKIMDNYTPLNALLHDHMLDLQSQFARAHRNTKTEDCNRIGKEVALISIAQSLVNISEILTAYTHNGILSEDDREENMPS